MSWRRLALEKKKARRSDRAFILVLSSSVGGAAVASVMVLVSRFWVLVKWERVVDVDATSITHLHLSPGVLSYRRN